MIKVNDSVKVDLVTGKIVDFAKFEIGNLVTVTKGRNTGRVGIMVGRERHPGRYGARSDIRVGFV